MCKLWGYHFDDSRDNIFIFERTLTVVFNMPSLNVNVVPHWPLCHIIDRCHHGSHWYSWCHHINILSRLPIHQIHHYANFRLVVSQSSTQFRRIVDIVPAHLWATMHKFAHTLIMMHITLPFSCYLFLLIQIDSMKIESELLRICGL